MLPQRAYSAPADSLAGCGGRTGEGECKELRREMKGEERKGREKEKEMEFRGAEVYIIGLGGTDAPD